MAGHCIIGNVIIMCNLAGIPNV